MSLSINIRQAYSEIDEFLSLLGDKQRNKVPEYLRELFNKEKDLSYRKIIIPNVDIKQQGLKQETLAIIAWLNLEYWCEDERERQRLKETYDNNEKKYQDLLQTEFDPNTIFKKELPIKKDTMIKYKENKIKKFIEKVKNMFIK